MFGADSSLNATACGPATPK